MKVNEAVQKLRKDGYRITEVRHNPWMQCVEVIGQKRRWNWRTFRFSQFNVLIPADIPKKPGECDSVKEDRRG